MDFNKFLNHFIEDSCGSPLSNEDSNYKDTHDSHELQNKYENLSIIEMFKCISLMLLFFIVASLINSYLTLSLIKVPIGFDIGVAFIIVFFSLLFVITKLSNKDNFYKSLILINFLYFIFEKISILVIMNILWKISCGSIESEMYESKFFLYRYGYSFNYILCYIAIFTLALILGEYLLEKNHKIINSILTIKLKYIILFVVSIILTLTYFMVSTRPYFFYRMLSFLGVNINVVHFIKGTLLTISILVDGTNIKLPNLGLIIIMILLFKIILTVKNKNLFSDTTNK